MVVLWPPSPVAQKLLSALYSQTETHSLSSFLRSHAGEQFGTLQFKIGNIVRYREQPCSHKLIAIQSSQLTALTHKHSRWTKLIWRLYMQVLENNPQPCVEKSILHITTAPGCQVQHVLGAYQVKYTLSAHQFVITLAIFLAYGATLPPTPMYSTLSRTLHVHHTWR